MNIIYFTTAQDTAEFNDFLKLWNTPINISNQTFHNKLIRSISLSNHVDVISIRPFSRKRCSAKNLPAKEKDFNPINWHYLKISGNKLFSYRSIHNQIKRLFKNFPRNSVIITDTINPNVLYNATYCAKKFNMPIIGVCTDSPSNITGTNRAYTMFLLKLAHNLDGYIALTSGLNELFNEHERPAIIVEGLVEDVSATKIKNEYGKYIFYCGALSERYGIYEFIRFYKTYIKGDIKLLLCGHHIDMEKLNSEINNDKRIIFLGNIPNTDVLSYEATAWVNINPRPFSEDLDRFSIPSKVLEYLNSGAPTMSVKNTKIQKYFSPYAIWLKGNTEHDYIEGFQKLSTFNEIEKEHMVNGAKENVQKYYSLTAINSKLDGFLYLFIKKH